MSIGKFALVILMWMLYATMLIRVFAKKKGNQQVRFWVWVMFFLACLAFTFTGPEIEHYTDRKFGGLPVSTFVKFFSLTQMAHLYYLITRAVTPAPSRLFQWLKWLSPLSLIGGVASFSLLVLLDIRNEPNIRYYVSAARDIVVALYMIVGIIPANLYMRRNEAVPTMRVKHLLNTLLCCTYVLVAVSSAFSLVIVIFEMGDIETFLPLFLPLTYACYFFFLTALVPHRWIAVLLIPVRLRTYFRLRRLQREVARLAQAQTNYDQVTLNILSLGELELAIYQAVIFILDHFTLISPKAGSRDLYEQLSTVVRSDLSYAALVEELAALYDD